MHYTLRCVLCGKEYPEPDDPFLLDCGAGHPPSLLRAEYSAKSMAVNASAPGIFRYADWLPVRRHLPADGRPAVYRSDRLAAALGLKKLFISFSGWWPEKGARLSTCSFKELEALSVCARVPAGCARTMVVASAGNTGRAFLQTGSAHGIAILVVVPESALPDMWLTVEKAPCVKLAVLKDGDYFDAITLAGAISGLDGYFSEGGAKNVARRDGMGTVLLAAAEEIGEAPAHYFQAVGSGTGGIAAWEMSRRLGSGRTRLHLVQNEPFALMTAAWTGGRRTLPGLDDDEARKGISLLHSRVLSNRRPPYGIAGGVFDALTESGGRMYAASNGEARAAGKLFRTMEGADLDPAAEVALAGLIKAVRAAAIRPEDCILFNATGGGTDRLEAEGGVRHVRPDYAFTSKDAADPMRIEEILKSTESRRTS